MEFQPFQSPLVHLLTTTHVDYLPQTFLKTNYDVMFAEFTCDARSRVLANSPLLSGASFISALALSLAELLSRHHPVTYMHDYLKLGTYLTYHCVYHISQVQQ